MDVDIIEAKIGREVMTEYKRVKGKRRKEVLLETEGKLMCKEENK